MYLYLSLPLRTRSVQSTNNLLQAAPCNKACRPSLSMGKPLWLPPSPVPSSRSATSVKMALSPHSYESKRHHWIPWQSRVPYLVRMVESGLKDRVPWLGYLCLQRCFLVSFWRRSVASGRQDGGFFQAVLYLPGRRPWPTPQSPRLRLQRSGGWTSTSRSQSFLRHLASRWIAGKEKKSRVERAQRSTSKRATASITRLLRLP